MLLQTARKVAVAAEQKLQEAFDKIIKAIYQTNKLKGQLDDITSFNNLDHAIKEARLNANSVRNVTIAVAEAVREQRVSKAVKESFKAWKSKSSLNNKVKNVETKAEEVKEAAKRMAPGLVNDVENEDVTTQDMLQDMGNHFLPTPEENPFIDYSVTKEEAETAVAELEAAAASGDEGEAAEMEEEDEKKDGGGKKRKSKKVRKSKKSKKTKRRKTKRRKSKKTKRK